MALPAAKSLTIKGRALSWRERGDGVALVLIHGTGGSSDSWAHQLDHFADSYRVIAWDAPGYGASEPLAEDAPAVDDYAGALAALLDALGVMSVHLVAHSVGAPIACALNRLRPGLTMTATLVHPVAGFGAADAAARGRAREIRLVGIEADGMAAFARARGPALLGPAAAPEATGAVTEIISAIPTRGYRQMVELLCGADMMADTSALRVPALVIAGTADTVAPVGDCRAIADALAKAEFRAFDGIGHYLPIEDPALFRRTLKRFLDAHGAAAAFATY